MGRTRWLLQRSGEWGADGGATPRPGVRIKFTICCLPYQSPPPLRELLLFNCVGGGVFLPGGNPTSIQAGRGASPSGQHRGPSATVAWKTSEKNGRAVGISEAEACCGSRGPLNRYQPQPQEGGDSLGEVSSPRDPVTHCSQPRPCLASPGSQAQRT